MSRKQWFIVAGLALTNMVVLGAMAVVVIRSLAHPAEVPPSPNPTVLPQPTATSVPTWTPTSSPTPQPSHTSRPTNTPSPTSTHRPTATPTDTPTLPPIPTPAPVPLENPTFEDISRDSIPGWEIGGFVNWVPGNEFDPATSYASPRFHQADDLRQWISGPTLQIDTEPWVKLQAWVFQTVAVEPGSHVQFQVRAFGFVKDTGGGYIFKVGVDPDGREGCEVAQWGDEQIVNQEDGVIVLTSPEAVVGEAGQVTVCAFAETQFAQVYHAAFFDDALLTKLPPARS